MDNNAGRLIMNKAISSLFLLPLVLSAASSADTQQLLTVRPQLELLRIEPRDGFDHVVLPGADMLRQPGAPALPRHIRYIEVPAGSQAVGALLADVRWRGLAGTYVLAPVQPPAILGAVAPPSLAPNPLVYHADAWYPAQNIRFLSQSMVEGTPIAAVEIVPLRYHPLTGQVQAADEITISLQLEPAGPPAGPMGPAVYASPFSGKSLRSGLLEAPSVGAAVERSGGSVQPAGYAVITSTELESACQPLIFWKRCKGLEAFAVTVEWITDHYPGRDTAERVRNYLRVAYAAGTRWVLIGGDTDIVPVRIAWAMDCEARHYADENDLGADLYYADLDGTWDQDGDGIFGEVEDNVDLWPELIVGRVAVANVQDVEAFTAKLLAYEQHPVPSAATSALFLAEVLWENPYTDSSIGKDAIDEQFVPPTFDPITKLYQSQGTETAAATIEAINLGINLLNHAGHAWYNGVGLGNEGFDSAVIHQLTNAPTPFVMFSVGCWSAAFDYPSFAEKIVNAPNGGAVAYAGNFRYGWGSPGNPGFGFSDVFDSAFYQQIFNHQLGHAGLVLAAAKAWFAPLSGGENLYRWHQYQLNLIGDPEMMIWTAEPEVFTASYPAAVPTGQVQVPVVVRADEQPFCGACVCLLPAGRAPQVIVTGADGSALFQLDTSAPGVCQLTVTAPNMRPLLGQIAVNTNEPYVGVSQRTYNDAYPPAAGNGDGMVNRGETVELAVILRNYGAQTALGVNAALSGGVADLEIVRGTAQYGDIAPGHHALPDSPFLIQAASGGAGDLAVPLTLTIEFGEQRLDLLLTVLIADSALTATGYVVYDLAPDGDEDARAEAGETVELGLIVENSGSGWAYHPQIELRTDDEYVSVLDSLVQYPNLSAGDCFTGYQRFRLRIGADCPPGHFPVLNFSAVMSDGTSADLEPVALTVGNTGFQSDMESDAGWTHGGTKDTWQLTRYRAHSPEQSFYCGNELTHTYENNVNAWLSSPEIWLAPRSELRFWLRYTLPVYRSDGVYVEVQPDGEQWQTFAFLGSGGALLNFTSDWAEYQLDLSQMSGRIHIRFRFYSDAANEAEGIFVDDVRVAGYTGEEWGSEPLPPEPVPTPTPGPEAEVLLTLNQELFHAGDPFLLTMDARNNGPKAVADVYLVLDAADSYWFWPSWTQTPSCYCAVLNPGLTEDIAQLEFTWPDGAGAASGLRFWGAMLNPLGEQFGELATLEFGFQ